MKNVETHVDVSNLMLHVSAVHQKVETCSTFLHQHASLKTVLIDGLLFSENVIVAITDFSKLSLNSSLFPYGGRMQLAVQK